MHTPWASERQVPPHTICDLQLGARGEERAEPQNCYHRSQAFGFPIAKWCELSYTLPIKAHDSEHLSQPSMLSLWWKNLQPCPSKYTWEGASHKKKSEVSLDFMRLLRNKFSAPVSEKEICARKGHLPSSYVRAFPAGNHTLCEEG